MYHTFAHLIIKSDLKLFMEYCFCYKIKGERATKKKQKKKLWEKSTPTNYACISSRKENT